MAGTLKQHNRKRKLTMQERKAIEGWGRLGKAHHSRAQETRSNRIGPMLAILEDAADWADIKSVDYSIFRDGGDWTMVLRFSDALGEYREYVSLYPYMKNPRGVLDAACVRARKERKKAVVSGKVKLAA